MKTIAFAFSLLFLLVLAKNSSAQISIGGRAGINLANFRLSEDEADLKNIVGFNVAAILEIGITDKFSIQPEISFIQKGSRVEEFYDDEEYVNLLYVNYIEIPVLAKYKFGTGKIGGFVQGGPSIGYATTGKFVFEESGLTFSMDLDFEEMYYNRLDFGFQFGAGGYLKAGPGNLFLDARYLLGLSNINTESNSDDEKAYSCGINLTVGYLYPIGITKEKNN